MVERQKMQKTIRVRFKNKQKREVFPNRQRSLNLNNLGFIITINRISER